MPSHTARTRQHLYRIFTRQSEPADNQYWPIYYVWADGELAAKVALRRRFEHAVIQDIFPVNDDRPLIMLGTC